MYRLERGRTNLNTVVVGRSSRAVRSSTQKSQLLAHQLLSTRSLLISKRPRLT